MSTIRVLFNPINAGETKKLILEYYNKYKDTDENPLELLDRSEGGFKIDIPPEQWIKDSYVNENDKIRQLRWSQGRLVSANYIGFTPKQYMLLFDALVYAMPGNVILEN